MNRVPAATIAAFPDKDLKALIKVTGARPRGSKEIYESLRVHLLPVFAQDLLKRFPSLHTAGGAVVAHIDSCPSPLPDTVPLECALFPVLKFKAWLLQTLQTTTTPAADVSITDEDALWAQLEIQQSVVRVIRAAQVLADARTRRPEMRSRARKDTATPMILPADINRIVAGLNVAREREGGGM